MQTDVGVLLQHAPSSSALLVVGADRSTAPGVCEGDVLFSIDGVSMAGVEGRDAVRMLSGRPGACAIVCGRGRRA
jgi:hypothetical protein